MYFILPVCKDHTETFEYFWPFKHSGIMNCLDFEFTKSFIQIPADLHHNHCHQQFKFEQDSRQP